MKDGEFCHCHHQIFHLSISCILQSLKPTMSEPKVVCCRDSHYHHTIYVQSWSLHWGLPGTVPPVLYHPRMVCKVSVTNLMCYLLMICIYRCTAKDTDLKAEDTACHHQEFTEALIEEFSDAKLWDEWGLVGDVIINSNHFYSFQY